jgi:hypothetical protein
MKRSICELEDIMPQVYTLKLPIHPSKVYLLRYLQPETWRYGRMRAPQWQEQSSNPNMKMVCAPPFLGQLALISQSDAFLKRAIAYLEIAEDSYLKLKNLKAAAHVQGVFAVAFQNLGMLPERDAASLRHQSSVAELKRLEHESEGELKGIWELVQRIGAKFNSHR